MKRECAAMKGGLKVRVVEHEPFVGSHPLVRRDHKHEIRLDDNLRPRYRKYVAFHERLENRLMQPLIKTIMSQGFSMEWARSQAYEKAHKKATDAEKEIFKKEYGSRWKEEWDRYMRHVYYVSDRERRWLGGKTRCRKK